MANLSLKQEEKGNTNNVYQSRGYLSIDKKLRHFIKILVQSFKIMKRHILKVNPDVSKIAFYEPLKKEIFTKLY